MTRTGDTPQVLGRFARATGAPRGLRSVMRLSELDQALRAVDGWRVAQAQIDTAQRALVEDLRGRGASWDSIAWLLGVSGEAVRKRFGPAALCACGKPAAHVHADPDSAEWACRVPEARP